MNHKTRLNYLQEALATIQYLIFMYFPSGNATHEKNIKLNRKFVLFFTKKKHNVRNGKIPGCFKKVSVDVKW